MTDQERGRIYLADFHRLQLGPAAAQAQYAKTGQTYSWLSNVLLCNLFESLCWLGLGATCSFFAQEDAQRVFEKYRTLLRESWDLYQNTNLAGFTPALEPKVQGLVSNGIIGYEWPIDDNLRDAQAAFGAALVFSRRLLRDSLAESTAFVLTFLPEPDWETLLRRKPKWLEVQTLLLSDVGEYHKQASITAESISAGFVHLLEHMGRSQAFFSDRAHMVSGGLLQDFGAMYAWRLKLVQSGVRNHYDATADLVLNCIRSEPDRSEEFEEGFLPYASSLAKSWIKDHPLWLSTGRNA
jgi:hypothetical protein